MQVKKSKAAGATLHLENVIRASAARCFAGFSSSRALDPWYDPGSRLTQFKPGGTVTASYFPSYKIVATVKNQLAAQRYTSIIDGVGIFSVVEKGGKTRVPQPAREVSGETLLPGLSRTFLRSRS